MKQGLNKTGIILLMVFLLPVLLLSLYEIKSLNTHEEELTQIYKHQLDAILFSVNQYANDVVSSYSWQVEKQLNNREGFSDSILNEFLLEHPEVIQLGLIGELDNSSSWKFISNPQKSGSLIPEDILNAAVVLHKPNLRKLVSYLESGYRKVEVLSDSLCVDACQFLGFAMDTNYNQYQNSIMVLDPENFVSQVLGPKIQELAQERYTIFVRHLLEDSVIFSTDQVANTSLSSIETVWVLDNYQLGIAPRGNTLEQAIKQRFQTDLLLIIALNLVLILGAIWAFRNLKREMQLAQAKSEFVSNVSHEIRTPLALISLFTETLQLGRVKGEDKINSYYDIIAQETRRLSSIVNKILNFSQIEANKRIYSKEDLFLKDVVEEVLNTYRYHLQNQGFEYSFAPEEDMKSISGDHEAIAEALINLIDNAIKYSPDHKELILKTGRIEGGQFIEVRDFGTGIAPEYQKAIFDKFFRVPQGDVHNVKGTGLGLTLVKHIMDAHRGKIVLRSTSGAGTTFQLQFPEKD